MYDMSHCTGCVVNTPGDPTHLPSSELSLSSAMPRPRLFACSARIRSRFCSETRLACRIRSDFFLAAGAARFGFGKLSCTTHECRQNVR